ncbi:MAG: type I methionyl aminopeptidase [Mycoplasmataceae bacterium]|nr:type I methionyl aminopeptidase [Mycoplasmataceae bacterium]
MINIKSEEEIKLIIKSANILAQVKKIVYDYIKPGVSLLDLDTLANETTKKLGGSPAFLGYQGFTGTICASVNEELIHGIPSKRILMEGDLVSIDMGVVYEGYYSDSAFTKAVGTPTQEDIFLIKAAEEAFHHGLAAIKPGVRTGDIAHAIGSYIRSQNLFTPLEFSGHGIGKSLHEEPYIYNDGAKGKGPILENNMVICIEPMILQKSKKIKILKDGWTVIAASKKKSSHYEQTILIKDGKGIVLT